MKCVIQRVKRAAVAIEGREHAAIGPGLLLLVGIEKGDEAAVIDRVASRIAHLRIFPPAEGGTDRMERSVLDRGGEVLVVSQFTLAGDLSRGRRPSFDNAAPPEMAEPLYLAFVQAMARTGLRVTSGVFRAMMEVSLVNDGPVTFVMDAAS